MEILFKIFIDTDPWIIFNAIVAWICGTYVLWYALNHANGKKPLRLLMAGVILYTALIYTLSIINIIPDDTTMGATFFRPLQVLWYLFPVWESRAEIGKNGKGKH